MMENSLVNYIKNDAIILDGKTLETSGFEVDGSELKNVKSVTLKNNANVTLVLHDIPSIFDLHFELEKDSTLTLKALSDKVLDNCKITANCMENAEFAGYFIDFSDEKCALRVEVELIGNKSRGFWKMASLSANNDNKKFDINVNHIGLETEGLVDNYGVCKDTSILEFCGTSYIKVNASKTHTIQNAKIMVLDKSANGIAKPILKIDHNDVQASHSACIGQMNEDHLFYLISRGLSVEEAERLIVLGYFNPIINLFEGTDIIDKINDLMEKRV